MTELLVQWIAGTEGLEAVREAWVALSGCARWFYQEPYWLDATARNYGAGSENVRWFCASEDDKPVAVAPLQWTRRRFGGIPSRVLEVGRYAPVGDGLMSPDADRAACFDALVRAATAEAGPAVIDFRGLKEESPLLEMAMAWDRGPVYVEREGGGGTSVISTDRTRDAWTSAMPRKLRDRLKRAGGKLAKAGGGRVVVASRPEDVGEAFDAFVKLEASGWKANEKDALANDAPGRGMLRDALVAAAALGKAKCRTLWLGDRLLASQLCLVAGDTMYVLKIAYDETASDFSPGVLLMIDVFQACCDDPAIRRVDLCSNAPWHTWYPRAVEPTYRMLAFDGRRWSTRLAGVAWHTARAWKVMRPRRQPKAPAAA